MLDLEDADSSMIIASRTGSAAVVCLAAEGVVDVLSETAWDSLISWTNVGVGDRPHVALVALPVHLGRESLPAGRLLAG